MAMGNLFLAMFILAAQPMKKAKINSLLHECITPIPCSPYGGWGFFIGPHKSLLLGAISAYNRLHERADLLV